MAQFLESCHNKLMPKQISKSEYDALLELIREFPDGAMMDEIIASVPEKLSRRTVLRRLNDLLEQGRLRRSGKGRATRYRNPAVTETIVERVTVGSGTEGERYIPVSEEGAAVKQLVRRPMEARSPVGYRREFLDSYRPNETWYLPADIRHELSAWGTMQQETRPAGTYANQILNRLLIDLSWNSSRLEGNSYSLLETEQLLELGVSVDNKDATEAQMILNHKAAIELLVDQADVIGFNNYTLLNLHAVLADNLLGDPQAGGRLRTTIVDIGGTVFHPLAIPQLIEECFHQVLATAAAIADPFEQSFFALVHLPYLQPFIDVNKRVSRLAANIPFIQKNLCPLSFVDVPERAYFDGILGVYELNRVELLRDVFIWAYQRSAARYSAIRQSMGEPDPFRLRYRQQIAGLIQAVIREGMNKRKGGQAIQQFADANVDAIDQHRFIEVTETELMGLHEGNFARYQIRPLEYQAWKEVWGKSSRG
jgi:Fic family protein